MMDNDIYIVLIYKNLKGEISSSELEQLNIWLNANPEHEEIERNLRNDWHLSGNYEPQIFVDDIDLEEEYAKLEERIHLDEQTGSAQEVQLVPKKRSWMRYAAAFALIVVASLVLYNSFSTPMLEFATNEGEVKELILPDGSQVTLNENSQLFYPATFKASYRTLTLKGEAFFEVVPNSKAPFRIHTENTLTTVLGTSFNLEEYESSESAKIAVYSGKVRFEEKYRKNKITLDKGKKARYSLTSHKFRTEEFSFLNDNSWKTHVLTFSDTPLSQVVADLKQYYGIDITLDETISKCPFNSRYDLKHSDIKSILTGIATSLQAELIEKDDAYQIKGGTCQ